MLAGAIVVILLSNGGTGVPAVAGAPEVVDVGDAVAYVRVVAGSAIPYIRVTKGQADGYGRSSEGDMRG